MLHITHTQSCFADYMYLAKNPISHFDADHKKIGSGFAEDTVGGQASGHGWGRLREGRQMVKKLLCKRTFDAAIETANKSKFRQDFKSFLRLRGISIASKWPPYSRKQGDASENLRFLTLTRWVSLNGYMNGWHVEKKSSLCEENTIAKFRSIQNQNKWVL